MAYAAYSAAWPSSQRWGGSLRRLQTGPRDIALTFDDGPSDETPSFLDELEALEVKATFFACGRNVARRPEVARATVEAGHAIGNHTYFHPILPMCSYRRVREEIVATQAAILDATGVRPTLFRPPFGLRSPGLRRLLPELGLTGVHWSVIGNDWKWEASRIARRVLAKASGRSIVCLHDGHGALPVADRAETLEAVRRIVPALRDRGYRFVRLAGGA